MQDWLKKFFPIFLESLPLFALIFVINPILIIFAPSEPYDYKVALIILGIACLTAALLTALLISFFSTKYRRIAIAFFRSLFIVFFIISIFFPASGGLVDGRAPQHLSIFQYVILYFAYIFAVFVLMVLFLKNQVVLRNIYISFAIVGLISVIYYPIQHELSFETPKYYSNKTDLTFASDRNIIFIFADMLQGATLEQYFTTINPSEKSNFEDFTLFSRATSPFPFTTYGAPAILSGNLYGNDEKKKAAPEAIKEAQSSSLLTDAESLGFDSTVVGLDIVKVHDDQFSYQSSDPKNTAVMLLTLSLQRIIKSVKDSYALMWLIGYKKSSKEIMDRLAVSPIGKSKNKMLFLHSMVPHAPTIFTRSHLKTMPSFLSPSDSQDIEAYWEEMGFFLAQLTELLNHMKKLGIYDKSLIIITGDHGHFISDQEKLKNYTGIEDLDVATKGPWARAVGMYNAAILIKPPLARSPLAISRVASSTLGLRALVKRYLEKKSPDILKEFEILRKNKVVVFKNKISSNPYQSSDDHMVLEFEGNVSSLAQLFEESVWKSRNILYKMGEKITDVTNYIDAKWLPDRGGAWLQKKPAILTIRVPNVEKKSYKLQVDFAPLVNKQHPLQRVHVSLNNTELGLLSMTDRKIMELDIPPDLLVKNDVNEFKFEPLDAISPKEIGAWATDFPLSAFLWSFQLVPKK